MTREEAIEWMGRIKDRYIHGGDEGFDNKRKEAIDMAIEALEAEPKHGKWIPNDNGTYSCSLCQSWLPAEQKEYARYCLYCSAKMDKE